MFIKTCILPELLGRFYTQSETPSIATVCETADEEASNNGNENLKATNSENSENGSSEDANTTNRAVNTTDDNRSSSTRSQWCYCNNDDNFNDMIACDSDTCTVQWFHYCCVDLTSDKVPEGKWYCPDCR